MSYVEFSGFRVRLLEPPLLDPVAMTSGPGLDGRQQWITREARVWRAQALVTVERTAASLGAYRAFLAKCRGPAGHFNIDVCNSLAPTVTIGEPAAIFDDAGDMYFNDAGTQAFFGDANPTADGAATAGATQITVSGIEGEVLNPGAYFSISDYLYIVEENAAGTLTFSPPLRQDHPDGQTVLVHNTRCRMRFESVEAARAASSASRGWHAYSWSLVEAFER